MLVNEFINGVKALKVEIPEEQLAQDYEEVNKIYMDLPQYFEKRDIYKMYVGGVFRELIERAKTYRKYCTK